MYSIIKKNSEKLSKAVKVLSDKLYDKEIIALINLGNPADPPISIGHFSKLKNAHTNTEYAKNLNPNTYKKIFAVLDSKIEEEYNCNWNSTNEEYEEMKEEILRLKGLVGTWLGYTWNKENSDKIEEQTVYVYKLQIHNMGRVDCATSKARFQGQIRLIGSEKISVELVTDSEDRRIYMIAHIGSGHEDSLKNIDEINFTYCDSGSTIIRAALTILKRHHGLNYQDIQPHKEKISSFDEGMRNYLIKKLKNSQLHP